MWCSFRVRALGLTSLVTVWRQASYWWIVVAQVACGPWHCTHARCTPHPHPHPPRMYSIAPMGGCGACAVRVRPNLTTFPSLPIPSFPVPLLCFAWSSGLRLLRGLVLLVLHAHAHAHAGVHFYARMTARLHRFDWQLCCGVACHFCLRV